MKGRDGVDEVWDKAVAIGAPDRWVRDLFDAAEAATAGVDLLIAKHDASLVAEIDPESFFNFFTSLRSVSRLPPTFFSNSIQPSILKTTIY